MGLALVVIEEHARRPMELAHHDALGAVDDERARLGHQRNLAEVDFLLLDVAHDALATLAGVVDHELGRDLDWSGERHAALPALVDVVLGLFQVVRDVDELARPIEILDGEDAAKHALEPDLTPFARRDVRLEELVVARLLDVDEVRDVDDGRDMTEVLAVAEVRLDLGRHGGSCFLDWTGTPRRMATGKAKRGYAEALRLGDSDETKRRRVGGAIHPRAYRALKNDFGALIAIKEIDGLGPAPVVGDRTHGQKTSTT